MVLYTIELREMNSVEQRQSISSSWLPIAKTEATFPLACPLLQTSPHISVVHLGHSLLQRAGASDGRYGQAPCFCRLPLVLKQGSQGLAHEIRGSGKWVEGQLQALNMMRGTSSPTKGNVPVKSHGLRNGLAVWLESGLLTGPGEKLGHIMHLFVQHAQADDIRTDSPQVTASTSSRVQALAKQAICLTPTGQAAVSPTLSLHSQHRCIIKATGFPGRLWFFFKAHYDHVKSGTKPGKDLSDAFWWGERPADSLPLQNKQRNTGFINWLLCALPCWPASPGGHMNHSNELGPL